MATNKQNGFGATNSVLGSGSPAWNAAKIASTSFLVGFPTISRHPSEGWGPGPTIACYSGMDTGLRRYDKPKLP